MKSIIVGVLMPQISAKTAIRSPSPAKPVHQYISETEYREVNVRVSDELKLFRMKSSVL